MSPIVARVRPEDVRHFACAPVKCCRSRSQYFGLHELHDGVLTLLDRHLLRGDRRPMCLELPGRVRRFATAPGFVCPGCSGSGGGLFVPVSGPTGDLLHSCLARYSADACACGTYENIEYVDCLPPIRSFVVRGELVASPFTTRTEAPLPPGLSVRPMHPGGGVLMMSNRSVSLGLYLRSVPIAISRARWLSLGLSMNWAAFPVLAVTTKHWEDAAGLPYYLHGELVPRVFSSADMQRALLCVAASWLVLLVSTFILTVWFYRRTAIGISLWPIALFLVGGFLNFVWWLEKGYFDPLGAIAGMIPCLVMVIFQKIADQLGTAFVFGDDPAVGLR